MWIKRLMQGALIFLGVRWLAGMMGERNAARDKSWMASLRRAVAGAWRSG